METVRIYDLVRRRALVTRDSARLIQRAMAAAFARQPGEVALDFSGVEAVTPSFVDEVLTVLDEILGAAERKNFRVLFLNPPTRLSAKFAAVGRGHRVRMKESEPGSWTITEEVA